MLSKKLANENILLGTNETEKRGKKECLELIFAI